MRPTRLALAAAGARALVRRRARDAARALALEPRPAAARPVQPRRRRRARRGARVGGDAVGRVARQRAEARERERAQRLARGGGPARGHRRPRARDAWDAWSVSVGRRGQSFTLKTSESRPGAALTWNFTTHQ